MGQGVSHKPVVATGKVNENIDLGLTAQAKKRKHKCFWENLGNILDHNRLIDVIVQ